MIGFVYPSCSVTELLTDACKKFLMGTMIRQQGSCIRWIIYVMQTIDATHQEIHNDLADL